MTRTPLAALALPLAAAAAAAQPADPPASGKYWAYVGTYTGGKSGSKGIYRCELDVKTGKLSEPEVAAEVGSPSFLAVAPNGKTLYAVGEVGNAGPKRNEGGVYAFRIDPATGGLTKIGEQTTGGPGPCYVSTDKAGKVAAVANYTGGSCAVFRLKDDGSFDARTDVVQHKGKGADPNRQEAPHAHCAVFDETGNYMLVADLGLDQVIVYGLDRGIDVLRPAHAVKLPGGSGPRHIALAPSNDLMFVCGELNSTVNVVTIDFKKGESETLYANVLSTLPGGKPVKGNSTAEVRIHPSGRFVYVSNRGHNSIAAFAWDGKKLTPIGHATEGIKVPRNFNIDPTGKWMLVANQDGNDIVVFEIGADGLPKPTGNKVAVPTPVCVKFLAKP
jgi:6-phosphogluconolactonase